MKKLISFLFALFSLSIIVSFHTSSLKENTYSYNASIAQQINNYSVVSGVENNQLNEYTNEFDMIVIDGSTIYMKSDVNVDDLYGSNGTCITPFTSTYNECNAFSFDKGIEYKFLELSSLDSNSGIYLINDNEKEALKNKAVKELDILEEVISFTKLESGYSESLNLVNENTIIVLLFIMVIVFIIVDIIKSLKFYSIAMINGVSQNKVYFKYVYKSLSMLYLISVVLTTVFCIYYGLSYNSFVVQQLITFSVPILVLLYCAIVMVSYLTFVCIVPSKVTDIKKDRQVFLKSMLLLVVTLILMTFYLVKVFDINNVIDHTKEEINNQYEKELESYHHYYFYGFLNELTEEEKVELQKVVEENIVAVEDNYNSTIYLSPKYANIVFGTNINSKNTYLIESNCGREFTYEKSEIDTLQYDQMKDFYSDKCVIVGEINIDYDLLSKYDLEFVGKDIKSDLLDDGGTLGNYNYLSSIAFTEYALYFIISIITYIFLNFGIIFIYLIIASRYEYYRYINDYKYTLLSNYMKYKILLNVILCILSLFSSIYYIILITILDVMMYIIFKIHIRKSMIRLLK